MMIYILSPINKVSQKYIYFQSYSIKFTLNKVSSYPLLPPPPPGQFLRVELLPPPPADCLPLLGDAAHSLEQGDTLSGTR